MPRYLIETGDFNLDVTVAADVNLDGCFAARCNDTGERIRISGWLMDRCELVDEEVAGEAIEGQIAEIAN